MRLHRCITCSRSESTVDNHCILCQFIQQVKADGSAGVVVEYEYDAIGRLIVELPGDRDGMKGRMAGALISPEGSPSLGRWWD